MMTAEDVRQMRFAVYEDGPRKGQQRYMVDQDYKSKVDKAYEKIYGNQPGRTSIHGG